MPVVESFNVCLEDWDGAINADHPVETVESALLAQLESPARLLRWAVVRVEEEGSARRFWCEGAYLKIK